MARSTWKGVEVPQIGVDPVPGEARLEGLLPEQSGRLVAVP